MIDKDTTIEMLLRQIDLAQKNGNKNIFLSLREARLIVDLLYYGNANIVSNNGSD